ncbi:hypothetical protein Clacol_006068 [Clathrus columnatus]|uniref:Methyltransferase domain-containing protein n=1 Tax=Clathrus columnatus TaxID=1419009 RepID=A0AAV5AIQ4_9AGAM|nr:hypothetical protein Clacol_006068 [Clathrus columnatus]
MSSQTIPTTIKTPTQQSSGQDFTGRMCFSIQGDASDTGGLTRTPSARLLSTADHPITRTKSVPSSQQPTSLKAKRSKATRGATLFKAFSSAVPQGVPTRDSCIEYDWGAARRAALFARDLVQLQLDNPAFEPTEYTMEDWVKDLLTSFPQRQWELSDAEVAFWAEKLEERRRYFVYKPPRMSNGSSISPHPIDSLPYPLSYDKAALQNDRHSYELLKRIYYDLPSIHGLQFATKPPKIVLDLGCGDGSWILDAAQCWKGSQFYGIDVQRVHPEDKEVVEVYGEELAKKVKFVTFNFLSDKLPFVDGVFEMVRMANLKWCIPANRWEDVLHEVRRVTARGGLIEIIDDDFIAYTDPDNRLTSRQLGCCQALDSQFAEVLRGRGLSLNTNGLMTDRLGKVFTKFHEDVIPVAISPETGVSHPRKKDTIFSRKCSRFNSVRPNTEVKRWSGESHSSGGSRTDSNSSEATLYSQESLYHNKDVSGFDVSSEESLNSDESHPLPPRPYPLGLVVSDRFLPCRLDAIYAHATKNMQAVLVALEAIRTFSLPKDPAFTSWQSPMSEMTSREYQREYNDWKNANSEFEDLFWTYETAMSERLNVNFGPVAFNHSDVREEEKPRKPEQPRSLSTIAQLQQGDCWRNGDVDHIARVFSSQGLDKLVRVIRVYTMWK